MPGETYKDYMEIAGLAGLNNSAAMGRLYNFHTAHASLNHDHKRWVREVLVPLFNGPGTLYVYFWGYASKIGDAGFNYILSVNRAEETKKFLATLISPEKLANVKTGGYGTSHSGGGRRDNNPIYRAVDVWAHRVIAPKPTPPPLPVKPPDIKPPIQMYFGPGVKGGGFLGVVGKQALEAHLYSVDDYHDTFNLDGEILTAGLGLGGGVNVQLVICYGGNRPADFIGTKFEGWDFNVSLGGRWADVLKGAKTIPSLVKIAKAVEGAKLGKAAIQALLKLSPKEWEQLGNLAKAIRDAHNADPHAQKPQVNSFDIPLAGLALEVDLFHYWGKVEAIY
jgi:hypothetical protein